MKIRYSIILLIGAMLAGYLGSQLATVVHAQTPSTVLQISGAWATHTSCTPVPAQTSLCLNSEGLWQSINGTAFTQIGAVGVISVNGKTGAVTISATTTTILQ